MDKDLALSPELAALVPEGTDIYDALMGDIEPDLLSVNLPLLTEKYNEEAPEERKVRMQRYKKAFEDYDAAFSDWIAQLKSEVEGQRHSAFVKAEEQSKGKDESRMTELESSFNNT